MTNEEFGRLQRDRTNKSIKLKNTLNSNLYEINKMTFLVIESGVIY